jgi:membrane-bound serine protease (ClpP class)
MGAATPIELRGGEAVPVDEKFVSYMRAEMRATAELHGRRGDVAEAMVDRTVVVDGIDDSDQNLLTATTDLALTAGIADATAADLDALLDELGLAQARRVTPETSWAEDLARFATDPVVSGILMSIGMLGILLELYSPGHVLPGVVGVTCLALFFGGHLLADLAGWEEAILLVAGMALLALEVLVVPGFGVTGIAGIALVVAALALSLVGTSIADAWALGTLGAALQRVLLSFLATVVGSVAVLQLLPARAFPRWLVLRTHLGSERGSDAVVARSNPDRSDLVGRRGVALTDLRLSGKVQIADEVVDVVSRLAYLPRGCEVVVTEVEGVRVVVDRADAPNPLDAEEIR